MITYVKIFYPFKFTISLSRVTLVQVFGKLYLVPLLYKLFEDRCYHSEIYVGFVQNGCPFVLMQNCFLQRTHYDYIFFPTVLQNDFAATGFQSSDDPIANIDFPLYGPVEEVARRVPRLINCRMTGECALVVPVRAPLPILIHDTASNLWVPVPVVPELVPAVPVSQIG